MRRIKMERRILGRTGIHVSAIGMGCEGFEGKSGADCEKLLDFAMEKGIYFF
jgi:aryl-alcohol dehydrogenase-like predicted oxidoreductase